MMKPHKKQSFNEIIAIISNNRVRTNILKVQEQKLITWLVQRIPDWMTSDMLTTIGLFGSIIVFLGFVLAAKFGDLYLLTGVFGFAINWFGDSLDGRIAYFRNKQRKWYGFSFDLTTDWIGVILMGLGFWVYIDNGWEIMGFCLVVLYGWEIMTSLLRYKVTDKYSIDSGLLGPTEVRIVISLCLILEILLDGSILYSSIIASAILVISNIYETCKLLKLADARDKEEGASRKKE